MPNRPYLGRTVDDTIAMYKPHVSGTEGAVSSNSPYATQAGLVHIFQLTVRHKLRKAGIGQNAGGEPFPMVTASKSYHRNTHVKCLAGGKTSGIGHGIQGNIRIPVLLQIIRAVGPKLYTFHIYADLIQSISYYIPSSRYTAYFPLYYHP